MQLDGGGKRQLRRSDNYRQLRHRETAERSWNTQRFERMMASRLASIENRMQSLESRIESEVQRRVSAELESLMNGPIVREMIEEQVLRAMNRDEGEDLFESDIDSESEADTDDEDSAVASQDELLESEDDDLSDSEEDGEQDDDEEEEEEEDEEEPEEEEEQDEEDLQQPSTSQLSFNFDAFEAQEYFPNKWEFISTFGSDFSEFTLDQFADPVRHALHLPHDTELFPRLSLEEMIERDHPTTSDEKKITSKNRPHGKNLTDEEFFCLAPCCSSARLFQAASCPFLPSFVKKRMVDPDSGRVVVQRRENGVELITPFKPNLLRIPGMAGNVEVEEEDPLENREVVEQLMHEHFLPTPHDPTDEFIFGPYLQKVRESTSDVPTDLLRALVRRVNSNLESSFQSHRELELFAELDKVPVDEEHGRIPLDRMNI